MAVPHPASSLIVRTVETVQILNVLVVRSIVSRIKTQHVPILQKRVKMDARQEEGTKNHVLNASTPTHQ